MVKINNRENYFETLTHVSKAVDRTIDSYLDNDEFGDYKKIIYEPLLEKKRGSQKSRATLSYLTYCALSNTSVGNTISDDVAKLITIPEFELWSEYMANWIFDNKGLVVRDPIVRKKTAVASKSFLEDAVKLASEFGMDYVLPVLNLSGMVTTAFTQEFDLSIQNKNLFKLSYEQYMNLYVNDYGIPATGKTFTLGSNLISQYLGETNNSQLKQLNNVFESYGSWLQVLNAVGDFSLDQISTDKVASDQFSDIRNGMVTPPIWLMYTRSNGENKKYLESFFAKKEVLDNDQAKLVQLFFESGSYKIISKQLKRKGRDLKKEIKNIGFHNEGSDQLQIAMTILESNKIYHKLEQSYEYAKEYLAKPYIITYRDESL